MKPETIIYRIDWNLRFIPDIHGRLKQKYLNAQSAASCCDALNDRNPFLEYGIVARRSGGNEIKETLVYGFVGTLQFAGTLISAFLGYVTMAASFIHSAPEKWMVVINFFDQGRTLDFSSPTLAYPSAMVEFILLMILSMSLGAWFGWHLFFPALNLLYRFIEFLKSKLAERRRSNA